MKKNRQKSVRVLGWMRRNRRVLSLLSVVSLLVAAGIIMSTMVNAALPNPVFVQIRDGSAYGGRSPNPGSMLLYRSNGNFWGGSLANPDPNNSTSTGFKHILKNQDSGQIRQIKLRAYYPTDAAARAAVYDVQVGICNFNAANAGSSVPRKMIIFMNDDTLVAGPHIKFDRWATGPLSNDLCDALRALQFSVGGAPAPKYDDGTGRFYNEITFRLYGDPDLTGQKNQVRFQLRHLSGSGTMGMAATNQPDQFGLIEGGADSEAQSGQRYSVAAGIRFGKSCLDNSNSPGLISVYDADAGKFGNSHIYIMRRDTSVPGAPWVRLGLGAAETMWNSGAASWNSVENRWDITSTNRASASIALNDFKNTYDYMLVYDNPDTGSSLSPTGNVISLGIPGDTIHGEFDTNCKFDLIPSVAGTSANFVGNYSFNITGTITNLETDTIWAGKTPPWYITKAMFPSNPDRNGTGAGLTDFTNCGWMYARGANGSSCTEIAGVSPPLLMPTTSSTIASDSGSNVPAGTWVCYITSIRAPQYVGGSGSDWEQKWRHSDMSCAVSVKKPSFGVNYGDVRTGGSFDSCRINTTIGGAAKSKYFGIVAANYGGPQHSYVNGSALSAGSILNFASYSAGPGVGEASMRGHFARGPGPPYPITGGLFYGDLDEAGVPADLPTHCLSPVFDTGRYYDPATAPAALGLPAGNATVAPGPDPTTTYIYNLAGGTLQLAGLDVPAGKRVVVRAIGSGTIILKGNITYSGSAKTVYDLPQFTLLADGPINIIVADTVTRLDGIYAGRGDFYTCQTYANNRRVTATQCKDELKINGSVIVSGRLYPHRTLGHDTPSDLRTAESFTLRPDVVLSDFADNSTTTNLSISSQRELPPRY